MKNLEKMQRLFTEFDFKFAVKWCYYKITKQYDKYISLIYKYLCSFLTEEINEFNKKKNITINNLSENRVWVCWWQGFNNMPDFCKMCYKQLQSVLGEDTELILITKENYKKYANIPQTLITKQEKGIIPVTQFSDILRQSLLFNNGGIWIDASIWCNEKINSFVKQKSDFWSIKLEKIDDVNVWGQMISECKWGSFLLGGLKGSKVYDFVFKSMCKYYEEHNFIIDYFLQNLLIRVAYENIDDVKTMIDNVPMSNPHLYDLYRVMDEPFDNEIWEKYTSDTGFFKLTQKRKYEDIKDGKPTFYKYLVESAGN